MNPDRGFSRLVYEVWMDDKVALAINHKAPGVTERETNNGQGIKKEENESE